jgi:hypothetical protein
MDLSRLLGVIVLFAAGSGPASADIFVWRDPSGVSHYTNDLANVPPEYRAEAMTVAKDRARAEPVAMPAAATVAADPGGVPPARDGYGAAYLAGLRAAGRGEPATGGHQTRGTERDASGENDPRNRVSAAPSLPFLQSPAGPPPIPDR